MNLITGDDDEAIHEQDRIAAHELAMKRPVERGGYWPREAADLPVRAPSQLGWPDYAAVAVVALFFAYALSQVPWRLLVAALAF